MRTGRQLTLSAAVCAWTGFISLAVTTSFVTASLGLGSLHIDHVPIAVRDLQSAAAQFRSLGFTIKPGRPHQNGIENASIKFADGSYVELITSHNGTDPLAKRYEEFPKQGEGASYVFLRDSDGAFTDHVRRAGGRREPAGPFAFTELPASWQMAHLQLTEYLAPAVDPPQIFQHANGATRVVAVWAMVEHGDSPIVRKLGAGQRQADEFTFDDRLTQAVELADRTRLMLTPRQAEDPSHVVALGILIEVDSLARLKQVAGLEDVGSRGAALWLPPSRMHGVWLGFVEHARWIH